MLGPKQVLKLNFYACKLVVFEFQILLCHVIVECMLVALSLYVLVCNYLVIN